MACWRMMSYEIYMSDSRGGESWLVTASPGSRRPRADSFTQLLSRRINSHEEVAQEAAPPCGDHSSAEAARGSRRGHAPNVDRDHTQQYLVRRALRHAALLSRHGTPGFHADLAE